MTLRMNNAQRWWPLIAGVIVAAIAGGVFLAVAPTLAASSKAPAPQPAAPQPAAPAAPAADANAPKVTKKATYGDWVYTCLGFQNGTVQCSIAQTLSSSETKKPVFQWRIAQNGKGGLVGIWQTPTGVLVNHGIVMGVGAPKPAVIPFEYCAPGGCEAVGDLAPDFVTAIAKADKLTATIFGRDGKGVTYPFSSKGLADGLAALK
jgi:invasion protein IalB